LFFGVVFFLLRGGGLLFLLCLFLGGFFLLLRGLFSLLGGLFSLLRGLLLLCGGLLLGLLLLLCGGGLFGVLSWTQLLLSLDHRLHTVVHVLDKILLGAAESSSVGDVVDVVVSLGVLTVGTADLNVVLVSDSLEVSLVLSEKWQVDVHGGAKCGTQVGWARGDVTQVVVMSELRNFLNCGSSIGQSLEHGTNVSTWLHGDDTELVLLIDPAKEGLGIVVEDTATLWPVTVKTASLKETVTLLEEEVISDQLSAIGLTHATEWVVLTSELTLERLEGLLSVILNLVSLLLGNTWAKWEFGEVTANTDTGRLDHLSILLIERWAVEFLVVHVADVLGIFVVLMVIKDHWVEEGSHLVIALVGTSIATNTRVSVLTTRENALLEGNTLRVNLIVELVPASSGQVLGEGGFVLTSWEHWETSQVVHGLEVWSTSDVSSTRLLLGFLLLLWSLLSLLGGLLLGGLFLLLFLWSFLLLGWGSLLWILGRAKSLLSRNHSTHTVVHILDEVLLGAAQSALVGDVVDVVVGFGVFTVSTTNLHVELIGDSLEVSLVLSKQWQVDVHGGAKCGTQVGWAGGDVSKVRGVGELGNLLNLVGCTGKSAEHGTDVGTLLHRDNSELVLFIDPHKEGLGIVVEDTTTLWPVSVETTGLKETVSLLEEEVISDELLLVISRHSLEGVVGSLEIVIELGESLDNELLDLLTLFSANTWAKWVSGQVATNTDTGGLDHLGILLGEWWAVQLVVVHVAGVTIVDANLVVALDDWGEKVRESVIGVWRCCVNTDSRISVLASRQHALLKCNAKGVSLVVVLVPDVLGHVLAEHAVLLTLLELWEALQVVDALQVGAAHGLWGFLLLWLLGGLLHHLGVVVVGGVDLDWGEFLWFRVLLQGFQELLAVIGLEWLHWGLDLLLHRLLLTWGGLLRSYNIL